MGADSLATVTKPLVGLDDLIVFFEESGDDWILKPGALSSFGQILDKAQQVPYNQMDYVTKLFSLSPLPMGAMFTGVASIGDDTVRSLVAEFKETDSVLRTKRPRGNYTVMATAKRMLTFFRSRYRAAYKEEWNRPALELVMGGYNRTKRLPTIVRVDVAADTVREVFAAGTFGIAFAGQMDWLQRIVFGTDTTNMARLEQRHRSLLEGYRQHVVEAVSSAGLTFDVPEVDALGDQLNIFHDDWSLEGLDSTFADFSEQNLIEAVDFFVDTMIRAQGISASLPTVGGNINIAVIRKESGFRFVSPQEWTHREHKVQVPEAEQQI